MSGIIQRHGNWEYMTSESDGKKWKRRVNTTPWVELDIPPWTGQSPKELKLVRQWLAPGKPDHWLLFLTHEGDYNEGTSFQVKGKATAMHHDHRTGIDVEISKSFKDAHLIAQPNTQQVKRVWYWATNEPPPSAPNQAAVQENSQGWIIRVIERLVAEGIVQQNWHTWAVSIKQPLVTDPTRTAQGSND